MAIEGRQTDEPPISIIRFVVALIVLATGCAGPSTEVGSALARPDGSASAKAPDVKGSGTDRLDKS
jgi:hypothetical protein